MFKVFAIDPTFLIENPGCIRFEDFGFEKGRLFGSVPKSWFRDAYELYEKRILHSNKTTEKANSREAKLIECWLSYLRNSDVKVKLPRHSLTPADTWYDTTRSISSDLLDGIIAGEQLDQHTDGRLITAEAINGISNFGRGAWTSESSVDCTRKAGDMTAKVSNLLRYSTFIHLIDPYFNDEDRFVRVLQKTLEITSTTDGYKEVVVSFAYGSSNTGDANRKFDHIHGATISKLTDWRAIPRNTKLIFRQWTEIPGGERLHERFIVTEKGGVEFGGGLDEQQNINQTTTLQRLSENQREKRFSWFDPESQPAVYKLLNSTDY